MTRPVHLSDLRARAEELRALPRPAGPCGWSRWTGTRGRGSPRSPRGSPTHWRAPVLHLDDVASHDELFAWTGRLRTEVLDPLSRGEAAAYHPYDWISRRFGPPRPLVPEPVVLVEGSGPAAAPCARSSPTWCGWTAAPRSPGGAAGGGTGRRRPRSGTDGQWRRPAISPRTPPSPMPMPWYRSARRDTRGCRGTLPPPIRNHTLTDRDDPGAPDRTVGIRPRSLPQLRLTGGRTGLTFSMCGFSESPQTRSPGCSP